MEKLLPTTLQRDNPNNSRIILKLNLNSSILQMVSLYFIVRKILRYISDTRFLNIKTDGEATAVVDK